MHWCLSINLHFHVLVFGYFTNFEKNQISLPIYFAIANAQHFTRGHFWIPQDTIVFISGPLTFLGQNTLSPHLGQPFLFGLNNHYCVSHQVLVTKCISINIWTKGASTGQSIYLQYLLLLVIDGATCSFYKRYWIFGSYGSGILFSYQSDRRDTAQGHTFLHFHLVCCYTN